MSLSYLNSRYPSNPYSSTLYRDTYTPTKYSNSNSYLRPTTSYSSSGRGLGSSMYASTSFYNNNSSNYYANNFTSPPPQTTSSSLYQSQILAKNVRDFSAELDQIFQDRKNQLYQSSTQFSTPKRSSSSKSLFNTPSRQSTASTLNHYKNNYSLSNAVDDLFEPLDFTISNNNQYLDDQDDYNRTTYTPSKYSSTFYNKRSHTNPRLAPPAATSFGILPPNRTGKRYTLVLDLDETLTHTVNSFGARIKFIARPGLDNFLREMSLYFEIVVFTAALQEYADEILNQIDPMGYISHRLYRQHMQVYRGEYVKDLSVLGRDLSKTLIIDNLRSNFQAQPNNGFEISDFRGQSYDNALTRLGMSLKRMVENDVDDVRMYPIRG